MCSRGAGLALLLCVYALALGGCEACSRSAAPEPAGADAGQAGLSPEQAKQVLARVGERSITLGDYAAALERMDSFERIRYQTEDRRQALLDEMINVELLAREAERRGLDRKPETQELVRQYQRDELLRRLRASLPGPKQLPLSAVQAYYQEHRAEFRDPERRRAAQIVLDDASLAARVVTEAAGADPERWRQLVQQYNPGGIAPEGDKTQARPPLEVPGDLGMLSAVSTDVPEPLRRAVFEIGEVGQVYPRPVAHAGRHYVLRLVSKLDARQRSLEEAEDAVRSLLVQSEQARAEGQLLERLRQSIPVSVDEAALERVPEPGAAPARSTP
jgi:peptidyl-prolyl cis-trans isomerase C